MAGAQLTPLVFQPFPIIPHSKDFPLVSFVKDWGCRIWIPISSRGPVMNGSSVLCQSARSDQTRHALLLGVWVCWHVDMTGLCGQDKLLLLNKEMRELKRFSFRKTHVWFWMVFSAFAHSNCPSVGFLTTWPSAGKPTIAIQACIQPASKYPSNGGRAY